MFVTHSKYYCCMIFSNIPRVIFITPYNSLLNMHLQRRVSMYWRLVVVRVSVQSLSPVVFQHHVSTDSIFRRLLSIARRPNLKTLQTFLSASMTPAICRPIGQNAMCSCSAGTSFMTFRGPPTLWWRFAE